MENQRKLAFPERSSLFHAYAGPWMVGTILQKNLLFGTVIYPPKRVCAGELLSPQSQEKMNQDPDVEV